MADMKLFSNFADSVIVMKLFFYSSLALFALVPSDLYAFDVTGIKLPSNHGDGAPVVKEGESKIEVTHESRGSVYTTVDETDLSEAADINSTWIGGSYGLAKSWDLGLYVKGVTSRYNSKSDAGFAHAGFSARYHLLNTALVDITVGGLLESTGASNAEKSIARSNHGRLAWFSQLDLGNSTANLRLNLGSRYRQPENYGLVNFGHEYFYGADLFYNTQYGVGVFGKAQSRLIKFKRKSVNVNSPETKTKTDYQVGLQYEMHPTALLALYGGLAPEGAAYGFGRKLVGVSLTMSLGKMPSPAKKETKNDVERNRGDEILDDLEAIKRVQNPKSEPGKVMDDFQLVDEEYKTNGLKESLKDQDYYADEEIKRLKEVEAKRLKLKQTEAERQKAERAKVRAAQEAQDARDKAEFTDEMQDEIDALPVVTDDEVRWQGLERAVQ